MRPWKKRENHDEPVLVSGFYHVLPCFTMFYRVLTNIVGQSYISVSYVYNCMYIYIYTHTHHCGRHMFGVNCSEGGNSSQFSLPAQDEDGLPAE